VPQILSPSSDAAANGTTTTTATPAEDVEVCQLGATIGGVRNIDVTSRASLSCSGDLASGPISIEVCPQVFEAGGIGWQNVFCGHTSNAGGFGFFTQGYGPYDAACSTTHEYRTWAWDDIPELTPATAVAISSNRYC
jgi:hypothetical protein